MFFTGGYAFGDIQHSNTPPAGAGLPVDNFNVMANGLTAGAGFAYAITNNVSAKFECDITISWATTGPPARSRG
jgi:outer membrane immunogenic protein